MMSPGRENLFRNPDALVKLFRLLDADQSGSLDRAEFAKGCEMINALADDGEKLFEMSDIDGFMDAFDVNGDGAISFAEFSDGLLNHGEGLRVFIDLERAGVAAMACRLTRRRGAPARLGSCRDGVVFPHRVHGSTQRCGDRRALSRETGPSAEAAEPAAEPEAAAAPEGEGGGEGDWVSRRWRGGNTHHERTQATARRPAARTPSNDGGPRAVAPSCDRNRLRQRLRETGPATTPRDPAPLLAALVDFLQPRSVPTYVSRGAVPEERVSGTVLDEFVPALLICALRATCGPGRGSCKAPSSRALRELSDSWDCLTEALLFHVGLLPPTQTQISRAIF